MSSNRNNFPVFTTTKPLTPPCCHVQHKGLGDYRSLQQSDPRMSAQPGADGLVDPPPRAPVRSLGEGVLAERRAPLPLAALVRGGQVADLGWRGADRAPQLVGRAEQRCGIARAAPARACCRL